MSGKELVTVAKATAREFGKDDVSYLAAALTYYAFFSLFPLLILAISLTGVFIKPHDASAFIFNNAGQFLPGSIDLLSQAMDTAFINRNNAGWIAIIGVVTLAFTASGAFDALDKAINRAWNAERVPSFIVGKLISFLMMVVVAAILVLSFLITIVLTSARTITTAFIGRVYGDQIFWQIVSFLASVGVVFLMLVLIYRFLPRADVNIRDVWPAALLAAIAWSLVKEGFAYYLGSAFAKNNDAVYGPLSAVIALLTWIYISSIIILTGAEFSSETARVRRLRLNTLVEAEAASKNRRPSPWLPSSERKTR